jgi:hypothetical protein
VIIALAEVWPLIGVALNSFHEVFNRSVRTRYCT